MKKITRLVLALGGSALSGMALATPCQSVLSSYQSALSTNDASAAAQILSQHPECFGGSAGTSQVQINGTAFNQVSSISTALGNRFSSGGPGPFADSGLRGAAAGVTPGRWTAWGNISNSDIKQRYQNLAGTTTNNGNDILNVVVGGDYTLSSTMVAGVSVALDRGTGAGSQTGAATVNITKSQGYTIAPYFGMQLNKEWALDLSAGYGVGDMNMAGTNAVDLERWFVGGNASYNRWMGNWQFSGKAGYLYAEEDYEDMRVNGVALVGSAAKNTLGQAQLGAQVGYWMNSGTMPYAGLKYSADVHSSTNQFGGGANPIGKDGWLWTLGVNFFSLASGVTGGVAYNQEEARSNQKSSSLTANVNVRF